MFETKSPILIQKIQMETFERQMGKLQEEHLDTKVTRQDLKERIEQLKEKAKEDRRSFEERIQTLKKKLLQKISNLEDSNEKRSKLAKKSQKLKIEKNSLNSKLEYLKKKKQSLQQQNQVIQEKVQEIVFCDDVSLEFDSENNSEVMIVSRSTPKFDRAFMSMTDLTERTDLTELTEDSDFVVNTHLHILSPRAFDKQDNHSKLYPTNSLQNKKRKKKTIKNRLKKNKKKKNAYSEHEAEVRKKKKKHSKKKLKPESLMKKITNKTEQDKKSDKSQKYKRKNKFWSNRLIRRKNIPTTTEETTKSKN
ncbi:nucleoprotein tpr-related [Anaeramoeba flamelloides]|uniref:Nucleoprotein tpr-related n=1 Tax=Anaeramoeba flamelloides TaxID=1746091 RepID=A0ABQ8YRV4_9EUKA|nr:nucleoprotein tpr-related [Anaeramoeba flamelloides]